MDDLLKHPRLANLRKKLETKDVSRGAVAALIAASCVIIVLLMALSYNQMQFYTSRVTYLTKLKNVLQGQNMAKDIELYSLKGGNAYPQVRYFIIADEYRPLFQTPYFHLEGIIYNRGSDAAYSVTIHVIAHRGDVTVIDTDIDLGTIPGEELREVNTDIFYTGAQFTGWQFTVEWD